MKIKKTIYSAQIEILVRMQKRGFLTLVSRIKLLTRLAVNLIIITIISSSNF
jgi:hypothetical protein